MIGRSNMVPAMMIVVIAVLGLIAVTAGRSYEPEVAVNDDYPYHICTFAEYCEGSTCSKEQTSFVLYTQYASGEPELDMARVNRVLTTTAFNGGVNYISRGGEVAGTLTLLSNRRFDFIGTEGSGPDQIEHFGTGECERLRSP